MKKHPLQPSCCEQRVQAAGPGRQQVESNREHPQWTEQWDQRAAQAGVDAPRCILVITAENNKYDRECVRKLWKTGFMPIASLSPPHQHESPPAPPARPIDAKGGHNLCRKGSGVSSSRSKQLLLNWKSLWSLTWWKLLQIHPQRTNLAAEIEFFFQVDFSQKKKFLTQKPPILETFSSEFLSKYQAVQFRDLFFLRQSQRLWLKEVFHCFYQEFSWKEETIPEHLIPDTVIVLYRNTLSLAANPDSLEGLGVPFQLSNGFLLWTLFMIMPAVKADVAFIIQLPQVIRQLVSENLRNSLLTASSWA